MALSDFDVWARRSGLRAAGKLKVPAGGVRSKTRLCSNRMRGHSRRMDEQMAADAAIAKAMSRRQLFSCQLASAGHWVSGQCTMSRYDCQVASACSTNCFARVCFPGMMRQLVSVSGFVWRTALVRMSGFGGSSQETPSLFVSTCARLALGLVRLPGALRAYAKVHLDGKIRPSSSSCLFLLTDPSVAGFTPPDRSDPPGTSNINS